MHSCSGQCGPSSSWDNCISSCNFKDLPVTICCGVGGPLSSLDLETTAAMFSASLAGSMAVTSTNAILNKTIQLLSAVKLAVTYYSINFRHYNLSVLLSGRGQVFSCRAVYVYIGATYPKV